VEQTYTLYRAGSRRRRTVAPAPLRLIMIAVVTIAGWTLIHRVGTTAAAQVKEATPLHPRSKTSVLVLNGNGSPGAASDMSTRLFTHGYRNAFATDAQVTTYGSSLVLFRRGWGREAERLAHDARIRSVAPLDGRRRTRYPLVLIIGR